MRWLLDTNVWIDCLRNRSSKARSRFLERSADQIFCCAVVRAEFLLGARKYDRTNRRAALVRGTLELYVSLPFDDLAAEHYARVRHDLERAGASIGPNDLFIAAICLAHESTLVTANTGEFQRVRGLRVENWTS